MNHSASYKTPERKAATRRFCSTPVGLGYPPAPIGPGETMNHSASYKTPERKAATRRFCSTPVGLGYPPAPISPGSPPDNEVAGEDDIHSFISSLDEFVEHCDTFLTLASPAPGITPRSSTSSSHGQPVEEVEPLLPQQRGNGEEEEDTYCEYHNAGPHEKPCTSANGSRPRLSAGVVRSGRHGCTDNEHENHCLRIVEFQQASGGLPLEGLYFGPDPTDAEQAPLENALVQALNQCFCHDPANCQGGPRCFSPQIECFDVESAFSPGRTQRPEPREMQCGHYAKVLNSSRRWDSRTFGDYDRVPGEAEPDLYLETHDAYCQMKDDISASREYLYHGGASEQHSGSYDASVTMEDDPFTPERCIDEDDWQLYLKAKYNASCQMEDALSPTEYPEKPDQLFPNSRCSRQDTVSIEQNEKKSKPKFYSSAACSSRSCHESLNSCKELNSHETEASDWHIPKASNQRLASKETSTARPVVAASSAAASTQSTKSSRAPDSTLPSKKESNDGYNASVDVEGSFTPKCCIDECEWQQYSNYDASCQMDDAFAPNEYPEGHENEKLDPYSRLFPNSRCPKQDTVAIGRNEKQSRPTFYSSAACSSSFCHKSLKCPETEASDRDIPKAAPQHLTSKEASTSNFVVAASSAANTQSKQSPPDCDATLTSKNKSNDSSTELPLHKAVDNGNSTCTVATAQSCPVEHRYSPLFFTDIIQAGPAPHMADKPACHLPTVGYDSAARSNSAGQLKGPVSSLESAADIDETIIACSTPSEDEIEFDEADVDIYEELDVIDEDSDDSFPANTSESKLVPTSSMPRAHPDVAEGSDQLDTTLVAQAGEDGGQAATNHACENNMSRSPPCSTKAADVLDIHLGVEDRTFSGEVQCPPLLTKPTLSTFTGEPYSSITHAKSTPSTFTSESQCSALPPEDPLRTSASGLQSPILSTTSTTRTSCNSTRSPIRPAAPSARLSGAGLPTQKSTASAVQSPNLLRATLVNNLKTQSRAKLAARSKVHVANFLDEYEGGSSPASLDGDPEVPAVDLLKEGEMLSSPTNIPSEGEIEDGSGSEDLRARINVVRGLPECQFEYQLPYDDDLTNIYSPSSRSATIDALYLETRQSVASPEIRIRDPFLSEDPAENWDNANPAWEALRQLTTEEERYLHVHKVWRSSQVPDPHRDLTAFHYRRRVAGLRSRRNTLAAKRGKRRASHEPSPSKGVRPAKRQRFDTDIFDLKLKELEKKAAKDFTEAKGNLRRNLDRLHWDIKRNEERQGSSHHHRHHHNEGRSQRHHKRAETAPSDYHYWRMQERQIREEFVANAQCINDVFSVKERQLLTARDEVHRFDAFYVGLQEDFDPRCLSESQLKQQLEAEKALGLFRLHYRPAQD